MKVAIIGGSGHFAAVLEGLRATPDARLVGVAPGLQGENLDGLMQRCHKDLGLVSPVIPDWRDLLDRERPDAVAVNSHFHLNGELVLECLKRGLAVYAEKPIATDLVTLQKIRSAWRARPDLPLIAMQELRYAPAFTTGFHHVRAGKIGRPLLLSAQKSYVLGNHRPPFYRKRASYGGTIPWIGIHAVDAILWYSGSKDPVSIYAAHATLGNDGHGEMESIATLQMRFADGALGLAHADFLRSPKAGSHGDDRLRVMGDKGAVEVRDGRVFAQHRDRESEELELEPRRMIFKEFLDLVAGRGAMLIDTEASLRATELSLYARQSADTGLVVNIPAKDQG